MAEPPLLIERDGGIVTLTLNRPEKRNALSEALLDVLEQAIVEIATDPAARVVILAAKGEVFSSGHDLSAMRGRKEEEFRSLFAACTRVMLGLRRLPQPVIARVQGMATAAGCQLVASCDLAVAATEARFATPGVKIGLFCTTPMVPLVRAIPPKAALEMLFTGEPITADRALALGLVNKVVAREQLDSTVRTLAESLLAHSSGVLQLGKEAFYSLQSLSEEDAYERAVAIMTGNALRDDAREGISAFLEKRKPEWTDR
jgi:enoyl-CoA hydratase/carnithine racemase